MTAMEKKGFYDRLCRILTNYEAPEDETERTTADELYEMLVAVQRRWDELTSE